MLVLYDLKGKIYFQGTGYPEPDGIPFLNVEIPDGKYISFVDVSKTPHEPIFMDYPKSEMEILQEENIHQQADIDYLMLLLE